MKPNKKILIIPKRARTFPIMFTGSTPGLARKPEVNKQHDSRNDQIHKLLIVTRIKDIKARAINDVKGFHMNPLLLHSFGEMSRTRKNFKPNTAWEVVNTWFEL